MKGLCHSRWQGRLPALVWTIAAVVAIPSTALADPAPGGAQQSSETAVRVALIAAVASILASVISGIFTWISRREAKNKIVLDQLLEERIISALEKQGGFLTEANLMRRFFGALSGEDMEKIRRLLMDPMLTKTLKQRVEMAERFKRELAASTDETPSEPPQTKSATAKRIA